MIITKESPLAGQLFTLTKPLGKEIPLRIGEIIEGQVADIYPSGGLTIKVKGGFLPVRSDLAFKKNEILFLKVLGQGKKNGEFILQLLNTKIRSDGGDRRTGTVADGDDPLAKKASELITKLIGPAVCNNKGSTIQSWEQGKLRVVLGELLKSLPANMQSIPKGLRAQLQQVLHASIQRLSPDLQGRIKRIIDQLSGDVQWSLLTERLTDLLIPVERLDSGKLKDALDNSGVFLEAKLKAMVNADFSGEPDLPSGSSKLGHDLKAILLQLQENIHGKKEIDSSSGLIQRFMDRGSNIGETEPLLASKVLGTVDTLVKDVETFQLLSKISDSLHTFLPIQWDGLKRGELVLKRKHPPKGTSYSCGIQLDLEKLGPVSVLLLMRSRNFYVQVKADHSELKEAIRSHLEELQASFYREGLNLIRVSILEKGDIPMDMLESMESEETLINIRI